MAGAQESAVTTAAGPLKQAIIDYAAAKRAPHTGSASTNALETAKRRLDETKRVFDTAHDTYARSMRNASQTANQKTYYVPRYNEC